ncbi:MAG: cytochrome c oxidase subunit 3 [Bacteroidetes bacterium]|nr:cytochrome c oxidase subunit 3 [Bacteroidota bacterium]
MSTNRKTRSDKANPTGFSRMEKFHPFKTLLFFGLVGSRVLFLSVVFLYFISVSRGSIPEGFTLPNAFSISTIFLLLSSYTISGLVASFKSDSFRNMKLALLGTLVLSGLFCVAQIAGWKKLIDAGLFLNTNVGVAYLYIITGLHFLHVVGGMIFLLVLTASVFGKSNNIAKSLLFLTDEYQLTRLQLITIYWHFVDAVWILLFFMFLFSF